LVEVAPPPEEDFQADRKRYQRPELPELVEDVARQEIERAIQRVDTGAGVILRDVDVTTSGSSPWGYGSLYGISGGLDYLAGLDGGLTPGFGRATYASDFAGALPVKVGTRLTPDVLLSAKTGAVAVHEMVRAGPTPVSPPFTRQDIAVRPVAGVGVEWAVTDRLSLAVEAGVVGNGLR